MIVVNVLYFAALKELAGKNQERLTLPETCRTVEMLLALLQTRCPALVGRLSGVRVAVNEDFVDSGYVLQPGDVVALIPPVSGG